MGKISVQEVSKLSVYVSLMIALTFIPYTGYMNIGPLAITTLPVFISIATWHMGWKGAVATSITFGLGSYFKSLSGLGSPLFVSYPELAIVPRFIMGALMAVIVMSLRDIKLWKVGLTSALAVVLNTFLVTAWYFLLKEYRDADELKTFDAWMILIYINFVVEFFVAIALGMATFKMVLHLRKDMANKKAVRY